MGNSPRSSVARRAAPASEAPQRRETRRVHLRASFARTPPRALPSTRRGVGTPRTPRLEPSEFCGRAVLVRRRPSPSYPQSRPWRGPGLWITRPPAAFRHRGADPRQLPRESASPNTVGGALPWFWIAQSTNRRKALFRGASTTVSESSTAYAAAFYRLGGLLLHAVEHRSTPFSSRSTIRRRPGRSSSKCCAFLR